MNKFTFKNKPINANRGFDPITKIEGTVKAVNYGEDNRPVVDITPIDLPFVVHHTIYGSVDYFLAEYFAATGVAVNSVEELVGKAITLYKYQIGAYTVQALMADVPVGYHFATFKGIDEAEINGVSVVAIKALVDDKLTWALFFLTDDAAEQRVMKTLGQVAKSLGLSGEVSFDEIQALIDKPIGVNRVMSSTHSTIYTNFVSASYAQDKVTPETASTDDDF